MAVVAASGDETVPSAPTPAVERPPAEDRVLDAAKRCCDRWGMAKVTVDDIAAEARISRATLYRLFPGGKDVLYEALRRRETTGFFAELDEHIARADSFEDLLVRIVVEATQQLRSDEHLQTMLASQPGEVAADLTVAGLPIIVENATALLAPRVARWIGEGRAAELAELLTRVVVSYFLAPSTYVDLGHPESAGRFIRNHVLHAYPTQ